MAARGGGQAWDEDLWCLRWRRCWRWGRMGQQTAPRARIVGQGPRKGPGPFTYLLLLAFDGLQDLILAVELVLGGVADAVHDVLRRAVALGVGGHFFFLGGEIYPCTYCCSCPTSRLPKFGRSMSILLG